MARQQQVDEALARAFDRRKPSGKVKAQLDGHLLRVWHYSYRMLTYDLRRAEPVEWAFDPTRPVPDGWKPTDKRILSAALQALKEDGQRLWKTATAASSGGGGEGSRHGGCGAAAAASVDSSTPAESVAFEVRVALGPRFGSVILAGGHQTEEKGSRFLALTCFPVPTRAAADAGIALLRARSELAGATHRIASYRATDGAEWMDDDGEDRAGSSLRTALRKLKAKGVAVVVARWYGGVNIGKARFRHVQSRATTLLYSLGHTVRSLTLYQVPMIFAGSLSRLNVRHTSNLAEFSTSLCWFL
eukprot:COSAG02_NODE_5414_length_4348_cov_3.668157_1_plen_302_part_00